MNIPYWVKEPIIEMAKDRGIKNYSWVINELESKLKGKTGLTYADIVGAATNVIESMIVNRNKSKKHWSYGLIK